MHLFRQACEWLLLILASIGSLAFRSERMMKVLPSFLTMLFEAASPVAARLR